MASRLWLVMQLIEANRHSAERLETAASTADANLAPLLNEIAAQSRRFADEIYEAVQSGSAAVETEVERDLIEQSLPKRRRA
jgi:hypothetical protein